MIPRLCSAAAIAAMLTLLIGCGGPAPTPSPSPVAPVPAKASILPVPVSSELGVGPNRYLFLFVDAKTNTPVSAPDRTASVSFTGPGGATIAATKAGFVWAIEGQEGIYVTAADFSTAGDWTAHFVTAAAGRPEEKVDFGFQVVAKKHVIVPGDKAPSVDTPTLASVGGDVSKISSDPKPDKAFYETSIAAALAAKKPFVVVFATPKFCKSATCGPTLDKIKPVAVAHPNVTFINVEPYKLADDQGQLQPVLDAQGGLQSVAATDAFGLISEPYVFVVGSDGIVKASFELIFTPDEIEKALANLN